ncbi:hypothetical protein H1C71_012720 [Ictidomys tridecemlineatus]|nr:hypothetical protein H1C71_012720 [Ictidomys tridecemlineatus]
MGAHQGDFVVMKSWLCLGVDPAEVNGVKPVKDAKRNAKRNAKANAHLREAPSFLDPVRQRCCWRSYSLSWAKQWRATGFQNAPISLPGRECFSCYSGSITILWPVSLSITREVTLRLDCAGIIISGYVTPY